ncbi:uncharacterized protein V6R79_020356 [Siganus canaliculatus]
MGNTASRNYELAKETIFVSKENEVYRIPALFYHREEKVIMAFAEQRSSPDDASTKKLVMKTGTLKEGEEGGDTKMIEVETQTQLTSALFITVDFVILSILLCSSIKFAALNN